jgi:uncharacterized repeat protein (TIGR03803 family)
MLLQNGFAQGQLWGTTSSGGDYNLGVIFKVNGDGSAYTIAKSFIPDLNSPGDNPVDDMMQASNGKIYGLVSSGGANNQGVLFEYNPTNGVFVKRIDFASAISGSAPIGGLIEFTNGRLYGVARTGGANDQGVLFEYNPMNNTLVKKVDFALSTTIGANPIGSLTVAFNGKLYGMTGKGGLNDKGVLFEYNPTNDDFVKRVDLANVDGSYPTGSLVQTSNGKLYGTTLYGGDNGQGCIFEFDLSTGSATKKFEFNSPVDGINPVKGLTLASNGKLYGNTIEGGTKDKGIIFEYDPANSIYKKKVDFGDGNTADTPFSTLTLSSNGKLYGTTSSGGFGQGNIFEYDPITSSFSSEHDFSASVSSDGQLPFGTSLIMATNGKLYGMTTFGGKFAAGVLFEYDLSNRKYTKKFDFALHSNGFSPYGSLTRSSISKKLYGLTISGGIHNRGVLFEYDPATKVYLKKIDFDGITSGGYFYNGSNIIESANGKFYWCGYGGLNALGAIYEFDPIDGKITTRFDFQIGATSGFNPYGDLLLATNGKLYGVTLNGGTNDRGVLFEFDPMNGAFFKKFDFDQMTGFGASVQGLTQARNGKLYGMTNSGGLNDNGTLYEYDLSISVFSKKFDFVTGVSGRQPSGFTESVDGNLYGVNMEGGSKGGGVLFEFNVSNGSFTKKVDFDYNDEIGALATKLTRASNNRLFGITSGGGSNLNGTLYEFDPTNGSAKLKFDFVKRSGMPPTGSLLFIKEDQVITFGEIPSKSFGDTPFGVSASSTSGLPISYSSSDPAVASISGNTITILKPGTTTITASQLGNFDFAPAIDVKQVLIIDKANQTVTFPSLPNKVLGDPVFNLSASSSSGLVVSYSATPTDRVAILNNQVTLVKAGRVSIMASQSGNLSYNPAISIDQSFCIAPAKPSVSVINVNTASPLLTSSSTSGNQWFLNNTAIGSATNQTLNATQSGIYKVQVKADDCLSEFSTDQNLIITGDIDNNFVNDAIEVFPSPTIDWLTITFSEILGKKEVTIYQLDGRSKDSQNSFDKETKFNVANYSDGIYIIKVLTDNTVIVKQFIKK